MDAIAASVLVAACIFGGGLGGLYLHRVLPENHLTRESLDVVKLGTGMLSVLASLVLGLLIATAKSSYDATDQAIRSYGTELALLSEVLRDYGGDASVPRDRLREYAQEFLAEGWPRDGSRPVIADDDKTRALLERVREAIRGLQPADKAQGALQDQAIIVEMNLLRQRLTLIEQQGTSVRRVVLVVLVSWITVIFVSFGLNAPRNGTVLAAFLICAVAIGASIFLILQLDRPLSGVMHVSSWPVQNALAHMNW